MNREEKLKLFQKILDLDERLFCSAQRKNESAKNFSERMTEILNEYNLKNFEKLECQKKVEKEKRK